MSWKNLPLGKRLRLWWAHYFSTRITLRATDGTPVSVHPDFMASGKTLVLLAEHQEPGSWSPPYFAVWGAIENLDPAGNRRWRCSIFRNETLILSSTLIAEATERTYAFWLRHYGGVPPVPLTTEVDPERIIHKRDPGRCFRKAGWRVVRTVRGLLVLEAPELRGSA